MDTFMILLAIVSAFAIGIILGYKSRDAEYHQAGMKKKHRIVRVCNGGPR